MSEGNKQNPYTMEEYTAIVNDGRWNGGWVYTDSGIKFINSNEIIENGDGTENNPYSLQTYNDMMELGIWQGGYVNMNGEVEYINLSGNSVPDNESGCGCGCGCGCGSGGNDSGMVIPGATTISLDITENNPCAEGLQLGWGQGLAIPTGSGGSFPDNGGVIAEITGSPTSFFNEKLFINGSWDTDNLKWTDIYKIGGDIIYEYWVDPKDKQKGKNRAIIPISYEVPDIYRDAINQDEGCV